MYTTLPYYLAKTCVELPYQLIMPIFFAIILYWIIGLRNTAECFWIFSTQFGANLPVLAVCLIVMSFFSNALGLFLGCAFSDVRQVVSLVPVLFLSILIG